MNRVTEKPLLIESFEIEAIKRSLNNDFESGTSHIGYWEWNIKTSQFYWSEQMFEIYDVEMEPVFDINWTRKIIPEDLVTIQRDIDRLIHQDIVYHNIHRVESNGNVFKVRAFAKKFVNSRDEAIIFGIAHRVET